MILVKSPRKGDFFCLYHRAIRLIFPNTKRTELKSSDKFPELSTFNFSPSNDQLLKTID